MSIMSATAANPLPASSTSSRVDPQQPLHLKLCILTSRVSLYPESPEISTDADAHSALAADPPDPTSPSTLACLLRGPLDNFLHLSGQEQSRWLIDIAHDACDPVKRRGLLRVWDAAGQTWRDVNPTDPLTASIYLYDVQTAISLTKISKRERRSKTNATGKAKSMASRVLRRDGGVCWVSRRSSSLTNSHVCPRRMGDHQLRVIYEHFVIVPPCPQNLDIHHEMCGITLEANLDCLFSVYELGLRHVGPDQYECHVFGENPLEPYVPVYGLVQGPPPAVRVHGFRTSPPQPQHEHNPPPGLIRWHYLQCVIRKFVHSDYENMRNINYYELPQRTEGDSDDEETDSELDWPSALFDRGRAAQAAMKENEERQRSISEWAISVS